MKTQMKQITLAKIEKAHKLQAQLENLYYEILNTKGVEKVDDRITEDIMKSIYKIGNSFRN